jgi:DNA-binding response OmpR family regulator
VVHVLSVFMPQATPKKVLLIDDENPIAETISAYAKKENMDMIYVDNGEKGLKIFERQNFDIVLLDWMLPGMSGLQIIQRIREKSDTPILMLSARNDETDIVVGLEMGADDYMTKPFGPRELMARIHALLRRNHKAASSDPDIHFQDLTISFQKKEVFKNGKAIALTPAEFRILEELCAHQGNVVSREDLMVKALGYHDFLNDRTLDTHIKNLRKKIENNPQDPEMIKTVRESGFKFVMLSSL